MYKWMGWIALSLSFCVNALAVSVLSADSKNDFFLESLAELNSTCADSSTCAAGTDYFSELEKLYAHGTLPKSSELVGWTTGRCYEASSHTAAEATLLVGYNEVIGGGNGPLFPATDGLKFLVMNYPGQSADVYDTITPALNEKVEHFLDSVNWTAIPTSCVRNDALSSTYGVQTRWQVRKAQDYLVLKYLEGTAVAGYCYYFKKVK